MNKRASEEGRDTRVLHITFRFLHVVFRSKNPRSITVTPGWSTTPPPEDLDIELEARQGIFEAFGADADGHLGVAELVPLGLRALNRAGERRTGVCHRGIRGMPRFFAQGHPLTG